MLTPRLTNCAECEDICSLIDSIDCKVAEMSVSLYNNVVFMLNKSFNHEVLSDLLNYKRILQYKVCNPNYAGHFTVNMIASKVRRFTSGCIKDCSCRTSGAGIIITTTSTSTIPPLTTTTTSSSSSTSTSTTLVPITTTTSSSSSSTTTSTSSSTTTTTTTLVPTTTTTTTECLNCVQEPVVIGTQTWDKCNLNVTTYRNGDPIPEVTDTVVWENLTTGAWCYYNNDPLNEPIYGKLYNWYAVNDPRGLAPLGKSIPTDEEWTTLTTYLEGEEVAGGKMRETGLCHWSTPNTDATNESGFTALGGGYRVYYGLFFAIGSYGIWWSSSELTTSNAWYRLLNDNAGNVNRDYGDKEYGFSVRCLIDNTTTTTTTTAPLALKLTFDNIANANVLVGDASSVTDWNTFFDLPAFGNPFTSVDVVGNVINLIGGSEITIKPYLFTGSSSEFSSNTHILNIDDVLECVISLDAGACHHCTNLETVSFPACTQTIYNSGITYNGTFASCTSLVTVNMPSLINIAEYTFFYCISLNDLTGLPILNTITSLNDFVFSYCSALTGTINLPSVTTLGSNVFRNCSSISEFYLPLLEDAGYSCFMGCTSIVDFNLPELLTAGGYCFYQCTSAITLNLPKLVTAGQSCFQDCTSVVNFNLPLLTTILGSQTFYNCTSASNFQLPLATGIGSEGFIFCDAMQILYMPSCLNIGPSVASNNVFFNILANTITLTIPAALMTCNSGQPDGDIQYLQANNTSVTIITT